ncbi:hypothetical protein GOBAR_AA04428 [Gossypium barbadense]|uniref:Uncharacterized protein n=1 Tax=Gossypium barbadense TaxID=3634 RepID=A0A2P5YKP4_GOSBA|nr:hypothetical protein GOBAR_AA04428 [Gossypium barbadense]
MVHVARTRHEPCLFHRPYDSALDGAASEGVISIGPYVTRLARHFGLLNTAAQYRLVQSTEEEAYEDIPDDVPPQHEGPPTQPPPPSRLFHAAASYADISERLT